MAYDPKDPADVKIVSDAVAAALEDARETHEAEITGLKTKNSELLGKLTKARAGEGGGDVAEITRLETELTETQGKLRTAEASLRQATRDLTAVTTERDTLSADLNNERTTSQNEFVQNRLTAGLVEAKVKPEFLEDLTASMAGKVQVKDVEGKRQAFVGDKSLGDYLTEWSQGDKGKHYVGAPVNNGGGSGGGGTPQGGEKKIYQMNTLERKAAYDADPTGFDARVAAGEGKAPPPSGS